MILGNQCTRRCRFCAVTTAKPLPPAEDEPQRLAHAVNKLNLQHVVITSVARDDLPDEGAGHFAACIRAVHAEVPTAGVEILPADFHARPDCITTVCEAIPNVFNHNLETVERLNPLIRPQAGYRRSLQVLQFVKQNFPSITTKSGLMVGLGETEEELYQTLVDLRNVGCEVITIGQYLQPAPRNVPVVRFYEPAMFEKLAVTAQQLGFSGIASGPFVRSSYHAGNIYEKARMSKTASLTQHRQSLQ